MTKPTPASLVSPAGEEPTPPTAPTPSVGSPRSSVGDGEEPTSTRAEILERVNREFDISDDAKRATAASYERLNALLGLPAGSPEGEPRGFNRLSDDALLAMATRFLNNERRGADTPVLGLALIEHLSHRLARFTPVRDPELRSRRPCKGTDGVFCKREPGHAGDHDPVTPVRDEPPRPGTALPMQPIEKDAQGVTRFRANKIVAYLLDAGGLDMNALAAIPGGSEVYRGGFSREDWEQFAQLIGYSVSGFGELDYVSDAAYDAATTPAGAPSEGTTAPPAVAADADWDYPVNFLRLAEVAFYELCGRTLVGNPAPRTAELGDRMRHPQVGDLVLEQSTIRRPDRLGERLGRLLRVVDEPVWSIEQWRANGGGDEPIPTHDVWYLRLPDGREYGWYNASFIAVPERITGSLAPVSEAFGRSSHPGSPT